MGNDLLFVGIIALTFLVLYIITRLSFKEKELNIGLQVLGLGTVIIMLFVLMPKVVLDDSSFCGITAENITKTGNNMSIEYTRTCFDNPNTTGTSFYKWSMWILRIIISLAGLYFIIKMVLMLGKIRLKGEK